MVVALVVLDRALLELILLLFFPSLNVCCFVISLLEHALGTFIPDGNAALTKDLLHNINLCFQLLKV